MVGGFDADMSHRETPAWCILPCVRNAFPLHLCRGPRMNILRTPPHLLFCCSSISGHPEYISFPCLPRPPPAACDVPCLSSWSSNLDPKPGSSTRRSSRSALFMAEEELEAVEEAVEEAIVDPAQDATT